MAHKHDWQLEGPTEARIAGGHYAHQGCSCGDKRTMEYIPTKKPGGMRARVVKDPSEINPLPPEIAAIGRRHTDAPPRFADPEMESSYRFGIGLQVRDRLKKRSWEKELEEPLRSDIDRATVEAIDRRLPYVSPESDPVEYVRLEDLRREKMARLQAMEDMKDRSRRPKLSLGEGEEMEVFRLPTPSSKIGDMERSRQETDALLTAYKEQLDYFRRQESVWDDIRANLDRRGDSADSEARMSIEKSFQQEQDGIRRMEAKIQELTGELSRIDSELLQLNRRRSEIKQPAVAGKAERPALVVRPGANVAEVSNVAPKPRRRRRPRGGEVGGCLPDITIDRG